MTALPELETSPWDIDPPFTWNGSDELKLREILAWAATAPPFSRLIVVGHAYRAVDHEIYHLLHEPRLRDGDRRYAISPPEVTTSREDAKRLIEIVLPGFWQTSGCRAGRARASIGPDFNGPDGDRLKGVWDENLHDAGFTAAFEPSDGPWRECLALLSCLIQAVLAERAISTKDAAS